MAEKLFTHCLRCGRKLKNPKYQEIGYGKVCWEKVDIENPNRFRLFQTLVNHKEMNNND